MDWDSNKGRLKGVLSVFDVCSRDDADGDACDAEDDVLDVMYVTWPAARSTSESLRRGLRGPRSCCTAVYFG